MENMDSEQSRKFFLGGLNYNTTEDKLQSYFGEFGTLVDCVVMRFPDSRRSRGFGFITFSTADEADACYNACPHTVDEKALDVKRATPREESNGIKGEVLRKVFIGGLNYETTDEGLRNYFGQYGEIVDCVVMKYKDTGRSRGFGFVTFNSTESVDEVQQNRPHTIDGSKVETKRATPREESGKESGKSVKKIFVGGLKDDIDNKDLEEYFSQYGNVTSAEHMTEKSTGRKRGFGFVEFDDYDPVDKLLLQPRHSINNRKVDIKKALGKDEVRGGGGGNFGGRSNGAGPSPWGGNQGFGSGFGGRGGGGGSGFGNDGGFGSGFGGGFSGNNMNGSGGWGAQGNPWQGGQGGGSGWGGAQGNSWSGNSGYMTGDNGWGGGYGTTNNSGMRGGGAMRPAGAGGGNNRNNPYPVRGGNTGGGRGGGRSQW